MDHQLLFIADYLRLGNISACCRHHGISRKTAYKWIRRYQQQGLDGLQPRSSRPKHCPERIPYAMRQAIIELRTSSHDPLGAKKIQVLLAERYGVASVPSKSSIYNILSQQGLIQPRRRRRRRMPIHPQPFAPAHEANEVWSVDFKGQFRTRDGQWVYPLTVMDHASRFLLACQGQAGPDLASVRQTFHRLFRRYGCPQRIRSDNGVPFASPTVGGLSQLSVWWLELGIWPERIEPGRPQQNSRHERMHLTLKRAACEPPARNLKSQQRAFDRFRRTYNEERPHEALGQEYPVHHYQASQSTYKSGESKIEYPAWYEHCIVATNGVVHHRGKQLYLTPLLSGKTVGLEPCDNGVWDIYFGPMHLGRYDHRYPVKKKSGYYRLKV